MGDARLRIAELENRLREAEETLDAIRGGDVDAVVVAGERGQQVYTLTNADRPYRVLIENMNEGAVTLSGDGLVVYCNASFAVLAGEPPERVVGAPFARFVPPDKWPLFERVFRGERGGGLELALTGADGAEIPALLSLSPIPDNPDGRIVCVIVTDLRERRQLHALEEGNSELERLVEQRTASLLRVTEERRVAEEALRQNEKLQLLGQFTGGIAHDFNNVLQVVMTGARLLRSPRTGDERRAKLLDGIEQSARNATEMVSRLLAFARRQPLNPKPFDLNERLAGMIGILRHTLGSPIEIRTEFARDLRPVLADPGQFEVALLNLAVNARDAMPSGGTLTLRTHNETPEGVEQVCVTVADTGTGMPPAVRARVFEPFFTTKEVGKGTGLGLPQVLGFAKQSGGDVLVESEPGLGTRVTICLPRANGEVVPVGSAAGASMARDPESGGAIVLATGKTILVVDDHREVASFAAATLEGFGYTVRQAGNAVEALALIDAGERVDAVFSDVVMPGRIDGAELASILSARRPPVAIVMATGYTAQRERLGGLAVEVLSKPYASEELAGALERALTKAGQVENA